MTGQNEQGKFNTTSVVITKFTPLTCWATINRTMHSAAAAFFWVKKPVFCIFPVDRAVCW